MSSRDAAYDTGDGRRRPGLRVIRGDATDDEIAALLAVLASLSAARTSGTAEAPAPASGWNDRAAAIRRPLPAGPGAWQSSGRPR